MGLNVEQNVKSEIILKTLTLKKEEFAQAILMCQTGPVCPDLAAVLQVLHFTGLNSPELPSSRPDLPPQQSGVCTPQRGILSPEHAGKPEDNRRDLF